MVGGLRCKRLLTSLGEAVHIFRLSRLRCRGRFPAESNPPDAREAECSPSVSSLLDRFDCPPLGKRGFNLFFRDPMGAEAADTSTEPGAEAPQPERASI